MDDKAIEVAGQLLVLSVSHPNREVRLLAEAAAKVVARDGLDVGRGWLQGLWYIGGNNAIPRADVACTYGDVVYVLQVPLGLQLVTR